jgi:hypothetical protein
MPRKLYPAFCLLVILAGCAGQRQLYDLPRNTHEYAKAVLAHHNALGESVLAMRADPLVSDPTKAALRLAYRKTVCSKDELVSTPTETCAKGPAQQLQSAAQTFEGVGTPVTEKALEAAINALTAALIDLIELTGGRQ